MSCMKHQVLRDVLRRDGQIPAGGAKIAAVPGSAFGAQGEGYIRFSYARSYERIVEGMELAQGPAAAAQEGLKLLPHLPNVQVELQVFQILLQIALEVVQRLSVVIRGCGA